jgi:NAD(P)-dependent dehydrogenase (short-subunit alcohol dehydrogenase family)
VIQVGPIEHMQIEDFENAMAVHLWGPLYTMLAAIPHMKRQGGGRIVNISSIGGRVAAPHLVPYAASKFALVGLSDGMRAELAKDGIKVTTVAPGLMRTGSPPNALFKGQHRAEYAWFSISDALPLLSIDAPSAARQIIEACRHGDPELTITLRARLLAKANALFPGLTARMIALGNRMLPGPTDEAGNEIRSGWQSQSSVSPSILTRLSDRATDQNNQRRDPRPMV